MSTKTKKGVDLGVVIKIHASGIGETNKGARAFGVNIGDKLFKRGRDVVIEKKEDSKQSQQEQDNLGEKEDEE
jgi:hypothetical protein